MFWVFVSLQDLCELVEGQQWLVDDARVKDVLEQLRKYATKQNKTKQKLQRNRKMISAEQSK